MIHLLRACAFLFVLLVSIAFNAPGHAQDGTKLVNLPAEKFEMAPGGVDMRTGRYVYSETDLSIGGDASSGGLVLTRTMTQAVPGHASPFGNFSHNWDIMIDEWRVNIDHPSQAGTDFRMFVNFGGRTQTFNSYVNAPGYAPVSGGGPQASLTFSGSKASGSVVYTYTAPDGTIVVFRPLGALGSGDCSTEVRCAFVSQITNPDGTVYDFHYVASGSWNGIGGTQRLQMVTSSRGYALVFEGTDNRVTKACLFNLALAAASSVCPSPALAAASYAYDMVNGFPVVTYRLTGVTGPDNQTASFTYGSGTIGFVRPGETTPWLVNTFSQVPDERDIPQAIVGLQTFADGSSYAYSYDYGPATNANPTPAITGGSYVNALGQGTSVQYAWPLAAVPGNPGSSCYPQICPPPQPDDFMNYVYQQTPGPVTITDPLNRVTTLDYCDPIPMQQLPPDEANRCAVVPLVSFTDPEGIKTDLQQDGVGNITQVTRHARPGSLQPNGQPWPNIVTSATYDTLHRVIQNKPTSMTDANGHTTDYTYDLTHGGLLTETGPAPSTGAPRPQTRHTYAQRTARLAGGAAAAPIWLRVATSTCRTSAATGTPSAPCATAGDEVLTQYDYGPDVSPNNLLLRGQTVTATDGGVTTTLRTCYTYDALGRRLSETRPNANLTSCP